MAKAILVLSLIGAACSSAPRSGGVEQAPSVQATAPAGVMTQPPPPEPTTSTTEAVVTTTTTEAPAPVEEAPETTVTTRARSAPTTAYVAVVPAPSTVTGGTPPDYIKQCESGGDYAAVNPNGHYGAWQFSISTWQSVGGTGRPDHASPAEQDYRAALLWDGGAGASHWACA